MTAPTPVTTVVVGAGQAGLATSRCLTDHGIDHVVLERGRVAERWRSERWDSLRLLTPNWQTRLPGWRHDGDDPGGFMTMPEVVEFLTSYAGSFDAPVLEGTEVRSVSAHGDRFLVETAAGSWLATSVVVATGPFHEPRVPAVASRLHPSFAQHTTASYRRPEQLPAGGVLVVGASASGVQLARELRTDGREVVLAVGSHTFLPRRYRGLDIQWWLEQIGSLDVGIDDVADLRRARQEPSLQLVGDPDGQSLGLGELHRSGVRLAGRLADLDGRRARFAGDLPRSCRASARRLTRVLDRIDDHIASSRLGSEVDPPLRPTPFEPHEQVHRLDLARAGVTNVLWATGWRRCYRWLALPVLDGDGEIRQLGGVTPLPGLYVVGLPYLRTRKSTFLDGVGRDAEAVVDHLVRYVRTAGHPAA